MKRILTLAATGLFVTGLSLLPLSVQASEPATGSKSATPAPAASTMLTDKTTTASGAPSSASPAKKDTGKTTVTTPATGGAAVKPHG